MIFPVDGFGIYDFVMGFIMGGYAPVQARWRNNDCNSVWYNFCMTTMAWSQEFDKIFETDDWENWLNFIIRLGVTGWEGYIMVNTCAL